MPAKTKKLDKLQDKLATSMQILGLGLMATAAVVGSVDLPGNEKTAAILPAKPIFDFANLKGEENSPLRREREETAPHFISYSEIQRTPGRAGKY